MSKSILNVEPLLDEIYGHLVVELKAQDAHEDEVLSLIGVNYSKTLIKMTVQGLVEQNRLIKNGNTISFVIDVDEESAPEVEIKPTRADRELFKIMNRRSIKNTLKDKEIRDKKIWGIGKSAITLVDDVVYDFSYAHPRREIGTKQFHNFLKNVDNENSFRDGIPLMREIFIKYRKEIVSNSPIRTAEKINKLIDEIEAI